MNICKHCGFTREAEYFKYPSGSICKECFKKRQCKQTKRYYQEHREHILKDRKEHHKDNKDKMNEKSKKYYKDNREKVLKRHEEYRRANPEKIAEGKKKHREKNRERILIKQKEYHKNNRKKELEQKRIKRRKNGGLPWTEIKSLRLGLYIEQTIATMFGSVAEPYSTPDIDFICPQGYKIQVKAASLTFLCGNPRWKFKINKNKVVDYFILVAVNKSEDIDEEDFKPTHIWMMEGNVLNNKMSTSITPSRISKWNKYSITEEYKNKFVSCCATIKKLK